MYKRGGKQIGPKSELTKIGTVELHVRNVWGFGNQWKGRNNITRERESMEKLA